MSNVLRPIKVIAFDARDDDEKYARFLQKKTKTDNNANNSNIIRLI